LVYHTNSQTQNAGIKEKERKRQGKRHLSFNGTHSNHIAAPVLGSVVIGNATITCRRFPELYRLVRSPGTRSLLYIFTYTEESQLIADAYRTCHGHWIEKAVLSKSIFFESVMYQSFLPQQNFDWRNYDYVITATYKTLTRSLLPKYMPLQTFMHMKEFLKLAHAEEYDVVPFLRDFEEMMPTSIKYHRLAFKVAWDSILLEMGYNQTHIEQLYTMKAFYRNVFIIKPTVLERLVDLMNRALYIAQSNEKIKKQLRADAYYTLGKPEIAMEIFGTNYYQLHPFLFERLPSFFLYSMNVKICTGPSGPCKYNFKG
jgi:hypothetical protein